MKISPWLTHAIGIRGSTIETRSAALRSAQQCVSSRGQPRWASRDFAVTFGAKLRPPPTMMVATGLLSGTLAGALIIFPWVRYAQLKRLVSRVFRDGFKALASKWRS